MTTNGWIYALAMYRADGTPLGQSAIDVDFEPARQWARHVVLCEGGADGPDGAEVQPLWHSRGEPYLKGFRVVLYPQTPRHAVACDFGTAYFRTYASALSSSFVETGALSVGDTFQFVPLAVPDRTPPPPSRFSLVVEDRSRLPRTTEASLEGMMCGAAPLGDAAPDEIPVLVPRRVLDDIVALTKAATPAETGGALVGHLRRDPVRQVVFVEVTGQVPAQHTEASSARLLFTSDSWLAIRAALAGRDETMVGWWHSHPVREWCPGTGCAHDDPAACAALRDCFSEHDRAVHRTVFPAAHSVALVVNDLSESEAKVSAYGWHMGMLRRRGLHVVGGSA